MNKDFSFDYIKELAEEMSSSSIISFNDFPQYDLFLSQVIDFLNDKFTEDKYTNNIVQNYIKSEVIMKPEDGKKRGYTKIHLVQLVLLSFMRPVLTTEEIKKVFRLAFNEINDRRWNHLRQNLCKIQKESYDSFLKTYMGNIDHLKDKMEEFDLNEKDEERIRVFIIVISLIAQASVIKKIVQRITNEYDENKN